MSLLGGKGCEGLKKRCIRYATILGLNLAISGVGRFDANVTE